jgi:hypothetical protein
MKLVTGARTLAEWGMYFDEQGTPVQIIELLAQDNGLLEDIPWIMGNKTNGHETTIRTGIPTPVFTRLYDGPQPTKSKVATVTDVCGRMEDRSEIDVRLLELNANSAAYRLSEAGAHIEGMQQATATYLFYGNQRTMPEAYDGLDVRYPYKDSPNVVDAGGSGSNCTSMWLIAWGDREVHGIFPRGTTAGLQHGTIDREKAVNADTGGVYYVAVDTFLWNQGICVRDWRAVVRVCNIDTTKLTLTKGETGFIDLHRLTIIAKNKMPVKMRARARWYCNTDVMTGLELQSTDAGNVQLRYGELFASKDVPYLHGMPVRQEDAIMSSEDALTATPQEA